MKSQRTVVAFQDERFRISVVERLSVDSGTGFGRIATFRLEPHAVVIDEGAGRSRVIDLSAQNS